MGDGNTLLRAKIAGEETGIEIKHTICDICSAGCGTDAYIKDGKVIKVEGTKGHIAGNGYLCTKGFANREYIYKEDRIKTPLKRIGKKGEGKFEAITWEEAYKEIEKKLNGYKKKFGADSVAFFTGYQKWYRTIFHRFVHSFGTLNYGTESSSCFQSFFMASRIAGGVLTRPDIANADLFIAWAYNPYYSSNAVSLNIEKFKKNGLKVIIIDPRITPTSQKLADIHLRPKPGTDGALAHGFARFLIHEDKIDRDFIKKHIHGFEEYAAYVEQFDIKNVSSITGISEKDIIKAAEMIAANKCIAINEGFTGIFHHRNGMQNLRAIMSISAITGNYDHRGGQIPLKYSNPDKLGPALLDEKFINEVRPKNSLSKIGSDKFPLWSELVDEFQAMDLSRHILEQKPYPIKAVFALGMNVRMFPDNNSLFKALEVVDFFVDTDLFMTDTAKYADIVLPACSSFERSQLISYGSEVAFTKTIIEPLYESKSDVDIICELAKVMNLDDELLKSGYENCCRYLISDLDISLEDLKNSDGPVKIPGFKPYMVGENTKDGYDTPSKKYELKSSIIEKYSKWNLEPLPIYTASLDDVDEVQYPFILTAGARIPGAFHSRLHNISWTRALRPEPTADINFYDGKKLNINQDDIIEIITTKGSIDVKANLTQSVLEGVVNMYHGYSEADVNAIIEGDHLDPYSGFPGYRSVRCTIRKKVF
ncbi:molybdopterin-dependent oxidoreductase [Clostridium sp. OS1-26]|uniref:molybdopterin-containing oxidoreductase family protein n=1 Tax=Clostridium sp. OS1-26 TaxID=3070681 RepID=UPI0027E1F40C|nr:molybdopterin-dependent oxidoreductase [Clostridium sp. OS1-26]WML32844.1 molybdopterin-dependent oxidoreductase [Clostridium sp. OS1-26]